MKGRIYYLAVADQWGQCPIDLVLPERWRLPVPPRPPLAVARRPVLASYSCFKLLHRLKPAFVRGVTDSGLYPAPAWSRGITTCMRLRSVISFTSRSRSGVV